MTTHHRTASPAMDDSPPPLSESFRAAAIAMLKRQDAEIEADDIRVITSADPATSHSAELHDLRDHRDNDAAADFLLDQVRGVTANPDTRLVASIAGGRKTMGARSTPA